MVEAGRQDPRAALAMTVVALATVFVDLGTKHLARIQLAQGPRTVVTGLFRLIYTENPGASFSMLRDAPALVRLPLFIGTSIAALAMIAFFARRLTELGVAARVGLALLAGGAIGNLVDRIRHGAVVDFLDVFVSIKGAVRHWPVFNVADVAICVGVLLLLVLGRKRRASEPSTSLA